MQRLWEYFRLCIPGELQFQFYRVRGIFFSFFLPPVSFKCVISLCWSSGYELHSTGKDELGLAGVVKGSQPGPLCPQSSPKWESLKCRSSSVTPLAYLGTRKTCGGGEGLKSGLERGWKRGCEPWATDAEAAARVGGCGMVTLGNTLGFGPTLGIPWAGKSLAKHEFFQQINLATGSSHWESSAHHHSSGLGLEKVGAHRASLSWATWSPEVQAEMKLSRAWSEGSLILARAQSKGIYF